VEAAWAICDPILDEWQRSDEPPLYIYEPGLWGPNASMEWMKADGRQWFDVCPMLH
jgi:glucose-6-phosphate 1-dehydrogenase